MSRFRSLALLAAVAALVGCYRWSAPRPVAPSALDTRPAKLHVTLTDSRQLVLRHPRVGGDSLLGVQVEQEPSGRYHVSFGLGGGSYPYEIYTQNPYYPFQRATHWYASSGIELDAQPVDAVRVSVLGGPYQLVAGDRSIGIVGGGQAAWEGRLAGFGAGFVGTSRNAGRAGLSAYLRLGDADGLHLRGDLREPTPAWLVSGWARAGLGYHLGLRRGFGAFIGLSRVLGLQPLNATASDATAVFGDLNVPLGRRGDLLVQGHFGGGYGVDVGVRTYIGP